jgi:hypothetical protein
VRPDTRDDLDRRREAASRGSNRLLADQEGRLPKSVLPDEAASWGADCIFVGARGLSRFERFRLGSVSAATAACAHCSVEIVRFGGRGEYNYAGDARRDPSVMSHAARLLLVAKRQERIGDYVTDICEQIVYMKEATVIKRRRVNS